MSCHCARTLFRPFPLARLGATDGYLPTSIPRSEHMHARAARPNRTTGGPPVHHPAAKGSNKLQQAAAS